MSGLGKIGSGLGLLWDVASKYLTDKQLTRNFTQVYTVLQGLTAVVVKFITAVLWWVGHLASAFSDVDVNANAISRDIDTITRNELDAWTTFLNTKYPADMQALYDAVSGHTATKVTQQQQAQKVNLKPLEDAIAALQQWKANTVTPTLKQWTDFYGQWQNTYKQPVITLVSWLRTPSMFAQWAATPLMSVAVSTLSQGSNVTTTTAIEQVLASTWANDSNAILGSFLNWLYSDT